jgi:hypothetical protein
MLQTCGMLNFYHSFILFIRKEALGCKDVLAPWYLFLLAISQ